MVATPGRLAPPQQGTEGQPGFTHETRAPPPNSPLISSPLSSNYGHLDLENSTTPTTPPSWVFDPALDTLLLRLHIETACRRGGALALMPDDLDPEQCLIRLREKGGILRWQPVSPTLMSPIDRARRKPRRARLRPAPPAVYRRRLDHLTALRLPLAAPRQPPPLGGDPAGQHALDTAHDPHLG
jgi:hypothetical protein